MTEFGNSVELVSSGSAGVPPARWAGRMPAFLLRITEEGSDQERRNPQQGAWEQPASAVQPSEARQESGSCPRPNLDINPRVSQQVQAPEFPPQCDTPQMAQTHASAPRQ